MNGVVITGGPGAGKTSLIAELARLGFATVSDSAREVIAERRARGLAPRPEPAAFAREILARDDEKYLDRPNGARFTFFDRSPLEALAMVHEAAPMPQAELKARLGTYRFHDTVFVLPPWDAIYRTDAERDHSFAHAERVHGDLVRWYRWCGYLLHEVPRVTVVERAEHLLRVLAVGGTTARR
jgi:predicted ATPase